MTGNDRDMDLPRLWDVCGRRATSLLHPTSVQDSRLAQTEELHVPAGLGGDVPEERLWEKMTMTFASPVRIRRSRAKDFNLQAHSHAINGLPAVNCARPSRFGNPFTVTECREAGFIGTDAEIAAHLRGDADA
jgi:hypothetical protein